MDREFFFAFQYDQHDEFCIIGWFNLQTRELFCLSVWSDRAWILWRDCKPITPSNV